MSKQSKKRARKRRKRRDTMKVEFVCPSCHAVDDGTPGAALTAVADALNVCTDAGGKLKSRHGILMSKFGYVLPMADGRWAARTVTYDRFAPILADHDDDFED